MTAGTQPNVPRRTRSPLAAEEPISWAQRLDALKNIPPLLRMVWDTRPPFAAAVLVLRLLRALVPLAVLWVGQLIIDAVVAAIAAHAPGQPVAWPQLWTLVVLELAIAVFGEAVARGSTLVESLLGDLFSNRVSVQDRKSTRLNS